MSTHLLKPDVVKRRRSQKVVPVVEEFSQVELKKMRENGRALTAERKARIAEKEKSGILHKEKKTQIKKIDFSMPVKVNKGRAITQLGRKFANTSVLKNFMY